MLPSDCVALALAWRWHLRGAGTYAVMGARMVLGMWSLVGATRLSVGMDS